MPPTREGLNPESSKRSAARTRQPVTAHEGGREGGRAPRRLAAANADPEPAAARIATPGPTAAASVSSAPPRVRARPEPLEVTRLLQEWHEGSTRAFERLAACVYGELHGIARKQLRGERPHRTLQTTGLVNEAFLRLLGQTRVEWHDRLHFYRVASQMMRRILIDEARLRLTRKRGGDVVRVALQEDFAEVSLDRPRELVAIDDALRDLQEFNPRLAEVVELRYFAGFTLREIAGLHGLSTATVSRRWRVARAWLYRELTTRS